MPYEYRKLSPEQQSAVVEARRQKGYPLHAPPHPFREAGTYLITAANFEHASIMLKDERRAEFQSLLLSRLQEACAEIIGCVILPNHYHILLSVERLDAVSRTLKQVHGETAYGWNAEDGLTCKRKVWYHFADRVMRTERQLGQSLNYIHSNPLKHRLVEDIYQWPWSSLFMYEADEGRDWLRQRWMQFRPADDFGDGWDN